ncbi:MAG: ABC transporter permease subunit [Ignisphaera sp.]|nr:ABC transporter permease subunit [Ignisphaera sp.]MCX8167852.1 ABC transporter permease subunit [Ignisphaera sp.]MDW8086126.1 ABC transporter permease subunit [Ignisphaera sp.]
MAYVYRFKELALRPKFLIPLTLFTGLLVYAFIYTATININPGRWYYAPPAQPPNPSYPFGTTSMGQDLFLLVPMALRNTIVISFVAAVISVLIAWGIGSTAALSSTVARSALMTLVDIVCVLPGLPLLMVIFYTWRDHLTIPLIGIIMGLIGWAFPARAVYAMVSSLRQRTFIYTSYFSGLAIYKIVIKDFIPFLLRYLMINLVSTMTWAIGNEVTTSIFGAMKMEEVTIGTTIHWAMYYQAILLGVWWWLAIPVVFLVSFVLSLYVLMVEIDRYIFARARVTWG